MADDKVLKENTRALQENTKALREFTKAFYAAAGIQVSVTSEESDLGKPQHFHGRRDNMEGLVENS